MVKILEMWEWHMYVVSNEMKKIEKMICKK